MEFVRCLRAEEMPISTKIACLVAVRSSAGRAGSSSQESLVDADTSRACLELAEQHSSTAEHLKLQCEALSALWSLLVGNASAKAKVSSQNIPSRTASLLSSTLSAGPGDKPTSFWLHVLSRCAMVLWSCAYGIEEARIACARTHGCLDSLIELLRLDERSHCIERDDEGNLPESSLQSVRHAAAGCLWHLAASSECAYALAHKNAGSAIANAMNRADAHQEQRSQIHDDGSVSSDETQTFCALAAGALSLHGSDVLNHLHDSGVLQSLKRLATNTSLGRRHLTVSLVFSGGADGVRPLTSLLESPEPAVQAIACALVASSAQSDSLPGYHSAATPNLIRGSLCLTDPAVRQCANLALSALGAPQLAPADDAHTSHDGELLHWLRREDLGVHEASMLRFLGISTLATLEKLSDADIDTLPLPLGVRRRLQDAVCRLREAQSSSLCTVCMQKRREAAFTACGHIVTCLDCSLLLWSQQSQCPVCRASIVGAQHVDVLRTHYA